MRLGRALGALQPTHVCVRECTHMRVPLQTHARLDARVGVFCICVSF